MEVFNQLFKGTNKSRLARTGVHYAKNFKSAAPQISNSDIFMPIKPPFWTKTFKTYLSILFTRSSIAASRHFKLTNVLWTK